MSHTEELNTEEDNMVILSVLFVSATSYGENLIVRFKNQVSAQTTFSNLNIKDQKTLVRSMGVYRVSNKGKSNLLKQLKSQPSVLWVQKDHPVKMRARPNDNKFSRQWGLENPQGTGIKADKAWDLGTGGKDRLGREIVVAVIDGGADITHRDLAKNIWKNKLEIPANKTDDDKNGFIDDVNGWNFYEDKPDLPPSSHGTHVAGIVGASGNNKRDIAGVNWNVKLMTLAGSAGNTSIVLGAYGYVLDQKKLWLSSGGKKGANVVATNSSFGIDGADCQSGEYPAWNDFYDEMGKHGILSAAAAPNNNVDIDKVGDVPTSCTSEFMISVTNSAKSGQKFVDAGYGLTTIDIAAPGTEVLSTITRDRLEKMTGTSMATPHIAGAIGLLHSIAPADFAQMASEQPAEAARQIKSLIMKTVTPVAGLKVVSKGRLNLGEAAKQISQRDSN